MDKPFPKRSDFNADVGITECDLWSMLISNAVRQYEYLVDRKLPFGVDVGTGFSIISDLGIAVESFVKRFLYYNINSLDEVRKGEFDIEEGLLAMIDRSNYSDLTSHFQSLTGVNYNYVIENVEGVSILVHFKNVIGNGNTPRVADYEKSGMVRVCPSYVKVYEYLRRHTDVLTLVYDLDSVKKFLTIKTLNHFFDLLPDFFRSFIPISEKFGGSSIDRMLQENIDEIENRIKANSL